MSIANCQQFLRYRLNKLIDQGQMSVKLAAAKTGLSDSQVSSFRNGQRKLGLRSLDRMAQALGFEAQLWPIREAPDTDRYAGLTITEAATARLHDARQSRTHRL
ncbi:MAG TPA: helix-turn-helix transcriptional regulator [Terracidiphilus sp.]|nr:helix-turn-helix transcriptional regulator [Terracidiphilus sp.]